MILRRAEAGDCAALAAVEKTRPQAAGWGEGGFAAELQQPCAEIWCACEEEQLVGFVALRAASSYAEILNVAVLPRCAKRGIAFALLSRAVAELTKRGFWRISLEVAQDNSAALALYNKLGMRLLGRRKNFYGAGRDALVMGKDV